MLDHLIHLLANLSVPIATIAEVLSGFSTFVIALLTLFLLRENKALRKAGAEPKIVAHFEIHPDGTGGLNIALSNVGTGPARDISFSFIADEEEIKKYDIILDHSTDRAAITLIPQGGKISFLFAIGYELFQPKVCDENEVKKPLKPFAIKVKWRSFDCRSTYSESYVLDVSQFAGLPGMMNKPYLLKIVDSLDCVSKQIGALRPSIQHLASLIDTSAIEDRNRRRVKGNKESQSTTAEHPSKDDGL